MSENRVLPPASFLRIRKKYPRHALYLRIKVVTKGLGKRSIRRRDYAAEKRRDPNLSDLMIESWEWDVTRRRGQSKGLFWEETKKMEG